MRPLRGALLSVLVIVGASIWCSLAFATVTFDWIRLLKPDNDPLPGWDPRVSVEAQTVSDPENDGFSDNADRLDFLHWAKNQGDVSMIDFYYHVSIPSNLDLMAVQNAVQASVQTWQDVPTANLVVTLGATSTSSPHAVDYMNVVSFSFDDDIAGFSDEEAIGKTLLTWDSSDTINPNGETTDLVDCDILLNAEAFDAGGQYIWSTTQMDYDNLIIDVQSVVTHEFGHVLGIAHPYSRYNRPPSDQIPIATCPTMYAFLQPAFTDNLNMRTLDTYDINCVTFLYPNLSDGNDVWQKAEAIAPDVYTDLAITEYDEDWYVLFVDQYETIKAIIIETSATNDLDLYLYYYDPAMKTVTQTFDVNTGSELRKTSDYWGFNYQTVFAHTLMQAGSYYIKVAGKSTSHTSAYTLKVYVSEDGDGDERSSNRTDPIPAGDGIPDWWELAYGLNPANIDDAMLDSDSDELINLDEYVNGLDPLNADTDGDELPDAWEVAYNLNPTGNDADEDPDNDGATNLEEYLAGTDPSDSESVFYVKKIIPIKSGPPEDSVKIQWAYEQNIFYQVLYSSSPGGPFTLMEEFDNDNIYENGVFGPEYIDQGYPFPDDDNEGAIRPRPLRDGEKRYYKIRRR